VHDLDRAALASFERLHDEQARVDHLIDEPLHFALLARQITQLLERHDRPGALRRHEPQQHRAHEPLLLRAELLNHAVGVTCERAGDATHRSVARVRQHLAARVARLP
jgi:hypothetical protein